ncbi:MAG: hypothetical protein ACQEXE_25120 [Bacillota bacterium]|uniref:hypothetical protein n=1 Tax=Bacillaceae TaxID=186817 RepID=UPI001F1F01FF|nr:MULTISPECIES: hypothetical protein [Bacillaceae]USK47425.1 hypothetical protein LIT27_28150 [Cytobacillus oceanisediminis]
MLEVSVDIPEVIQANQEIVIQAAVIQGKEKVEVAIEVKLEVKKAAQIHQKKWLGSIKAKVFIPLPRFFKRRGPIR